MISRDEFIAGYCRRSGIDSNTLIDGLVVVPCDCEQSGCEGWAVISADEKSVELQYRLYVDKNRMHIKPYGGKRGAK